MCFNGGMLPAMSPEEHNASPRARLQALYERHKAALLGYAWTLTGDRHAAEDIVHDTFVACLSQQLPATATELLAYVYVSIRHGAYNISRAHRTAKQARQGYAQRLFAASSGATHLPELESVLLQLPEEQREVLFLKVFAEHSLAAIAALLQIPVGTAASRYDYAKNKLRETLRSRSV